MEVALFIGVVGCWVELLGLGVVGLLMLDLLNSESELGVGCYCYFVSRSLDRCLESSALRLVGLGVIRGACEGGARR